MIYLGIYVKERIKIRMSFIPLLIVYRYKFRCARRVSAPEILFTVNNPCTQLVECFYNYLSSPHADYIVLTLACDGDAHRTFVVSPSGICEAGGYPTSRWIVHFSGQFINIRRFPISYMRIKVRDDNRQTVYITRDQWKNYVYYVNALVIYFLQSSEGETTNIRSVRIFENE